ncbi:MAG: hypothetical protein KBS52_01115 [Clostridiales bacterium]|nr:hypothetical protein [Candidatus Equinaster intestinalis]
MLVTPENYEEKRKELLAANSNLLAVVAQENELRLDKYLDKLKAEFKTECGGEIDYSVPVLTDKKITNSRLYAFCSKMPKGADLHVHDMALLPSKELVELLIKRPEFCINTDRKNYDLITVPEAETVKPGYMRFYEAIESGYYTKDEVVFNWTAPSVKNSGKGIWDYFEELFERHAYLSSNPDFAAFYYDYTFRYYCRHGIMHVEIHIMLTDSIEESAEYVKVMRQAYYNVKKDYPYFTVRIIGAGVKADNDNIDFTKKCFLNASFVQETVKDESNPDNITNFVIGFDLVNEEDKSLPLSAFAPMLLKVKKQYPEMKLYIHGGESLDASNENLIDAYLLGVSRVGHGLNLYRYPDLHARFVEAEICLEICPISNQVLGYAKDIRNHPATEYLRTGMAMALCSDDPTYMENETLTDDFFAGVIGWNLSVADLKQLGINSIMYSGLDDESKFASLRAYHKQWNNFVESSLENIDKGLE